MNDNKFIVALLEDGASATIFVREVIAYHSRADDKTVVYLRFTDGHLIVDAPKKDLDEAFRQLAGNLNSVSLVDPEPMPDLLTIPSVPYSETTEDDILAEINAALK